jgi:cellobiose PTS system EIIA component
MEDLITEASMDIILHAGDARMANFESIEAMLKGDLETAELKLREAKEQITIAHRVQTDRIQDETRGGKSEYSLLFAHAQDTLMTINSEILLTNKFKLVFEAYEHRMKNLENKVEKLIKDNAE